MHKDDQMTPKERAFALFAGKPVDRMPIKLFSPYIGMNFGASYQDAFVEAKSRAHWLIESYKRFGQDGLSVNYRIDGSSVPHLLMMHSEFRSSRNLFWKISAMLTG